MLTAAVAVSRYAVCSFTNQEALSMMDSTPAPSGSAIPLQLRHFEPLVLEVSQRFL